MKTTYSKPTVNVVKINCNYLMSVSSPEPEDFLIIPGENGDGDVIQKLLEWQMDLENELG